MPLSSSVIARDSSGGKGKDEDKGREGKGEGISYGDAVDGVQHSYNVEGEGGDVSRLHGPSVGPVCVVLRPTVYGRHWRHVIDTAAATAPVEGHVSTKAGTDALSTRGGGVESVGILNGTRSKPRVTSGYLFLLTALELAGQELPGEEDAHGLGDDVDDGGTIDEHGMRRGAARSRSGVVTLYGFEDDARNLTDGSGGHYFDSLHKQHHSLYDVGWERGVMAGLVRRRWWSGESNGDYGNGDRDDDGSIHQGVRMVRCRGDDLST